VNALLDAPQLSAPSRPRNHASPQDFYAWRSFVKLLLGAFAFVIGLIFAAIILVDPFDSGRFPTFIGRGVSDENQQTANVSRGRDPRFNAAVFGNSHAQLIDPSRLSQATGLSFVQLTSPGSGPREMVTTLRYFMRHHARADAVVLSADQRWCSRDPAMQVLLPFPFWLYRGNLEYLSHLLSSQSVSASQKRIRLAMGRLPRTDPAGYSDYETGRPWTFHPKVPQRAAVDLHPAPIVDPSFPPLDLIDNTITELPSGTRVVVVMPPQFFTRLPQNGQSSAAELAGCKHELMRRASRRPNSAFLDFLLDTPVTREPANFMDFEHYRSNIARLVEQRISESLRTMLAPGGQASPKAGT
jgi:hypothetical protein